MDLTISDDLDNALEMDFGYGKMETKLNGISLELKWLKEVIEHRVHSYFDNKHIDFRRIAPPKFSQTCMYGQFVKSNHIETGEERLLLALAMSKIVSPELLDIFFAKNKSTDRVYSEFGGVHSSDYDGFEPTLQTACFLLSGDDVEARLRSISRFNLNHPLFTKNILHCGDGSISGSMPLHLSERSIVHIFYPEESDSVLLSHMAANRLETLYSWEDLILPQVTTESLQEIDLWLRHSEMLLSEWGMNKQFNRGFKALFYGPPGTGKTLTAALLGARVERPVFRIDLSQMVSKYIGETSKNLDELFEKAQKKNWILFFDEADSLFGKRTNISNSNDRHANQETAHLLQRIETCENLVILASNLKDNIDEAFLRRFQSIVHFPKPGFKERQMLWERAFSDKADTTDLDFMMLAKDYELSGAEINNIVRIVSLIAVDDQSNKISLENVIFAIRKEKLKSGQLM